MSLAIPGRPTGLALPGKSTPTTSSPNPNTNPNPNSNSNGNGNAMAGPSSRPGSSASNKPEKPLSHYQLLQLQIQKEKAAAAAAAAANGSAPTTSGPSTLPNPASNPHSSGGLNNNLTLTADKERQSNSPDGDDEEEDEEGEGGAGGAGGVGDEEGRKGKKRGKRRKINNNVVSVEKEEKKSDGKEYRYSTEIAQMMFVFGEVQDPLPETVRMVEDIVRGQIIEIITRARLLTHLRSSRFLSADDVIFLIRDDRAKVNRLRTYLSWKDVRKRAKDDENGDAAGDMDVDEAEKGNMKIRKTMVKLPWEILTPFSDLLKGLPSSQNREDEDEDDEDELQAYQDSMQRLRDADELTRKMTKDEYVHYSDCRQASFTYRKAKRFREFVNFQAYLDINPNDEVVDILGFLSFEMVRTLCVLSLEMRDKMERIIKPHSSHSTSNPSNQQRRGTISGIPTITTTTTSNTDTNLKRKESPEAPLSPSDPNMPRPLPTTTTNSSLDGTPMKKQRTESSLNTASKRNEPISLFAPPPSARQPLLPVHVLEAFSQIQRQQANSRVKGMRNFRGGLGKGRLAIV